METQIVEGYEKLIAEFVPITFNPSDTISLREIERRSGLTEQSIAGAEWIKAPDCRKPGQKVAFTTIRITNDDDTNQAIQGGLIIEGKHITANKAIPDPSQCYGCQMYPKPLHFTRNCPHTNKCGTCGAPEPDHTTQTCLITDPEDQFCVSCDTKGHPSWARQCPTFIDEKQKTIAKTKSTNYRFFPIGNDPTTWEELNIEEPPYAPYLPSSHEHAGLTQNFAQTDISNYEHNKNQRIHSKENHRPQTHNHPPGNRPITTLTSKLANRNKHTTTQTQQPPLQMRLDGYGYMPQKNTSTMPRDPDNLRILSSQPTHKANTNQNCPPSPAFSTSPSRPIRESLYEF
jgi:hypothetical protein